MRMEGGGRERGGERKRVLGHNKYSVCTKFTKSFLLKYAAITRKADWCIQLCVCFDSGDVLRAITVSLLANYHEKQMDKVSSVGEEGASHMLNIRCGDTVYYKTLLPWR